MKRFTFFMVTCLCSLKSYSDCGCEDQASFDLTYIDADSKQEIRTSVRGWWWPINYSLMPYSRDKAENDQLNSLNLEQQLEYRLNPPKGIKFSWKWKSLRKVEIMSTPIIETTSDGKISFSFIKEKEKLELSNIKKISKVHELKVGCDAWLPVPQAKLLPILSEKQPDKVKKIIDDYGYEYYKVGYELKDEYINFKFRHNYDGSCI